MTAALPSGYSLLERSGMRAFAWSGAMDWLATTLEHDGALAAWAAGPGSVALEGGRGDARAREAPLAGPDGRSRWVCRRYLRGGWIAAIMRGDRHLVGGTERPFLELAASAAARVRGLRTPAVVAGAVHRAGPFYRADIVTEQVPEARTLSDRLWGDSTGREVTLRAAGRAVAGLEQARIVHADLSAGNLMLTTDGSAWVIDLDRCRILPEQAAAPVGRMRRRLERSLRKLGNLAGRPLSESDWETLRRGYEEP